MDEWAALALLLTRERAVLLAEWRHKVRALPSAQLLSVPALNDHVPKLLDELVDALEHPERHDPDRPAVRGASVEHGLQRARNNYEIGEVVAEYSMLRGCIHTLAEIHGVPLRDGQVQVLNSVLDRAIAIAVQAFAQHCEELERKRREEHLAFVAHDLRTPLNAVLLATHALERNGQQPDERARMIDVLKRNVRQLSALVDTVLHDHGDELAQRRGQPQPRRLQLWPLAQHVLLALQPVADASATRLANQVPDDLMLDADAAMLRQLLQSLLRHALLRAPGGQVVVAAGPGLDGAGAWIEVRDDGTSVAPDRLRELLQRPATTATEAFGQPPGDSERESGPEHSLGITLARAFAESHGGTLHVQSSTARGSTLRVQLLPG